MVRCPGQDRDHRLGDVSSPVTLGDGIQLERTLSLRAALSTRRDLCCDRHSASNWLVAHQSQLADLSCQFIVHYYFAPGLCNGSKCDAPTSVTNLQFGQLCDHRILYWIKSSDISRSLF